MSENVFFAEYFLKPFSKVLFIWLSLNSCFLKAYLSYCENKNNNLFIERTRLDF